MPFMAVACPSGSRGGLKSAGAAARLVRRLPCLGWIVRAGSTAVGRETVLRGPLLRARKRVVQTCPFPWLAGSVCVWGGEVCDANHRPRDLYGAADRGCGVNLTRLIFALDWHGPFVSAGLNLAHKSRELIRAGTAKAGKGAREPGVRFGRLRKLTPHQRQELLARLSRRGCLSIRVHTIWKSETCRLASGTSYSVTTFCGSYMIMMSCPACCI
jgi:hypothetical protein